MAITRMFWKCVFEWAEPNDKSHGEERIWEMTSDHIMSIEYHLDGHTMSQPSSGQDINPVKWDPLRLWKVSCKWIPHVERTHWRLSCLDKPGLKSQARSHTTYGITRWLTGGSCGRIGFGHSSLGRARKHFKFMALSWIQTLFSGSHVTSGEGPLNTSVSPLWVVSNIWDCP